MTDATSTDAIEQWLSSWSAAPRGALGAGAIAIGLLAATVVSRRLLPAPPPEPEPAKLPRSFRLELLPLLVLVYFGAGWLAAELLVPPAPPGGEPPLRSPLLALEATAAALVLSLALWTSRFGDGLADLGFTSRQLPRVLAAAVVFYVAWFPVQIGATALESGIGELVHWTPREQPT